MMRALEKLAELFWLVVVSIALAFRNAAGAGR